MAASVDNFLFGEDLDLIFSLVDGDFIESDETFENEISSKINEVIETGKKLFKCELCKKVYISERGLKRHKKAKHEDDTSSSQPSISSDKLKEIIEYSASKLINEKIYSVFEAELKLYQSTSLEKINMFLDVVQNVIKTYNGNAEKFYPKFYSSIAKLDIPFPGISKNCGLILGYQTADCILANMSGASLTEEGLISDLKISDLQFSNKETSIICYIGGYVIGTIYKRSFQKAAYSLYYKDYRSLLLLHKLDDNKKITYEYDLIVTKDRGGLWKINSHMLNHMDIYFVKI